jgi:hypothetical protein
MLALLNGADGAGFVQITSIVYVQLSEGILQAKDFTLRKLRVFSAEIVSTNKAGRRVWFGGGTS